MGVFDVLCGVSRISTLWRPKAVKRMTCSMFLLEELGGSLVPWTPPVRGTYDRYGGIELWPEDVSEYTKRVGDRLWSLWEGGELATSWPGDLEEPARYDRSRVERVLKHGAETVYNGITVTIDGRRVAACIVLDAVAAAIADATKEPPRTLAAALAAWFPTGGAGREYFADLPSSALTQLARYACVAAYVRGRAGFLPIRGEDLGQHGDDDIRRSVRDAWEREVGPIRRMIDAYAPSWTTRWHARAEERASAAAEAAVLAADLATAETRAYSPRESFEPGEVIEHPSFGRGRVEAIVDEVKIRVRFADQARILVHRPG